MKFVVVETGKLQRTIRETVDVGRGTPIRQQTHNSDHSGMAITYIYKFLAVSNQNPLAENSAFSVFPS